MLAAASNCMLACGNSSAYTSVCEFPYKLCFGLTATANEFSPSRIERFFWQGLRQLWELGRKRGYNGFAILALGPHFHRATLERRFLQLFEQWGESL